MLYLTSQRNVCLHLPVALGWGGDPASEPRRGAHFRIRNRWVFGPVKVGVQLPEVERRVPWPELIEMARTAEAVGLDSIWLGDHLLYDLPDGTVRGPWEVYTSAAALAAVTTRVQIGTLVSSLGFHDPEIGRAHV